MISPAFAQADMLTYHIYDAGSGTNPFDYIVACAHKENDRDKKSAAKCGGFINKTYVLIISFL